MPGNRHFWRNVAIIGVAHIIAIIGVVRWNSAKQTSAQDIVWVNADVNDGDASSAPQPHRARSTTSPNQVEAEPPAEKPDEDPIVLASAKSEIQLPVPTATPTPTPAATVQPSVAPLVKTPPKPSPRPPRKPRPKPTPRPTPKPTPKPRVVLAKASPKPTPDVKPEPVESDEEKEAEKDQTHTADVPAENASDENRAEKAAEHAAGTGEGSGSGQGRGMGKNSQFASYGKMLHDRFYGEWDQPTSAVQSATKISTMVRVRIEKNGRISAFEIIRPSGNVLIDDSVAAIGKRVTRVDPLPDGLVKGRHYDVKINFELNSD